VPLISNRHFFILYFYPLLFSVCIFFHENYSASFLSLCCCTFALVHLLSTLTNLFGFVYQECPVLLHNLERLDIKCSNKIKEETTRKGMNKYLWKALTAKKYDILWNHFDKITLLIHLKPILLVKVQKNTFFLLQDETSYFSFFWCWNDL